MIGALFLWFVLSAICQRALSFHGYGLSTDYVFGTRSIGTYLELLIVWGKR